MFVTELYGANKEVKVIYPGRFQPPHTGHAKVYNHLCQKFGEDNVYIVTSDKVESPKSPFNFAEKAKMWALTGVNTDRVLMDPQPYRAEKIVSQWDAANTILLFAVSEKDMAEDPRFQFKTKKDGSPSYFQPFKNLKQCEPLNKHAYMMTVPTFDFTVLGKPANSATQIRAQFASADLATQRQIVTDLFGKFDNNVFNIMKARLEGTQVAEGEEDDIAANIQSTTGRSPEEARRIMQAARKRALKMHGGNEKSMGFDARYKVTASQLAMAPKGKEGFITGESKENSDQEGRPTPKTLDPRAEILIHKARMAFPRTISDEEALALYLVAKEENDVKLLQKVNDTEDKLISSLGTVEQDLIRRLNKIEAKVKDDAQQNVSVPEDRATTKPPKKGSLKWQIAQQRKEYDKKNPPVEPADQMVGTAKILPKKTEEGVGAKKFGVRYKIFTGKEGRLATKEVWATSQQGLEKLCAQIEAKDGFYEFDGFSYPHHEEQVNELSPATHASHAEKRGAQVIPTLMKDVKKGAKMGRAVGKSLDKVKAFNKKPDEPNVFTESTESNLLDPDPKIRALATAVVKMKKELHDLTSGQNVIESVESEREICSACDGRGTEYGETCVTCGGKGYTVNGSFWGDEEEIDEGWKGAVGGIAAAGAIGAAIVATPPAYVNNERYDYATSSAPATARTVKADDGKTIQIWTTPRVKAGKNYLYRPVEGSNLKESEASSDDILYELTSSYRAIMDSDAYSPDFKDTIRFLYYHLRSPLIADNMEEFSEAWDYGLRKYPDAMGELVDTVAPLYVGHEVIDEGWKSKVAGAALAASMAFGGGAANASPNNSPTYDNPGQSTASVQASIDYTKAGPITYDSTGQKLEYGIPVDAKGNFQSPANSNCTDAEFASQLKAYKAWQADYKKRWPNGAPKPAGTPPGKFKAQTESVVPGFGEMRPDQVKKEVEGLTAEMLQYARDGNMKAVAEYIKKLQPFVNTANSSITESIDKALRTAKRNAI